MLSLHTTLLKRAFVVPVLDDAGAALALNHGKATPERSLLASIFAHVDEMGGSLWRGGIRRRRVTGDAEDDL